MRSAKLPPKAIAKLAGKISAEVMQQMNYQVDDRSLPVKEVVNKFLAK